nr:MAG: hypothetical protein [Lake Baikal virophage 8]
MTTTKPTNLLAIRIQTDLQLYFDILRKEDLFDDWNGYILEMVKERIFSYSKQVMTTELGDEKCVEHWRYFSDLVKVKSSVLDWMPTPDWGKDTFRDAFVYFGASITEEGEPQPVQWNAESKMWVALDIEESVVEGSLAHEISDVC